MLGPQPTQSRKRRRVVPVAARVFRSHEDAASQWSQCTLRIEAIAREARWKYETVRELDSRAQETERALRSMAAECADIRRGLLPLLEAAEKKEREEAELFTKRREEMEKIHPVQITRGKLAGMWRCSEAVGPKMTCRCGRAHSGTQGFRPTAERKKVQRHIDRVHRLETREEKFAREVSSLSWVEGGPLRASRARARPQRPRRGAPRDVRPAAGLARPRQAPATAPAGRSGDQCIGTH